MIIDTANWRLHLADPLTRPNTSAVESLLDEIDELRAKVEAVREWVNDAYALGLVAPDGAGAEMLAELSAMVGGAS